MGEPLRIGLIGFGNIGTGVVETLHENRDLLDARCPRPLQLRRVADIDLETPRKVHVDRRILTKDSEAVVRDPEIDVIVELIGGLEPARTLAEMAIHAGKHVVTANKAMLANFGADLLALAVRKGVRLLFEAAVGGGIPVVRVLSECLAANRITRIKGILNGTCNYILSRMELASYQEALAEAQDMGYAEADPTADVESIDAAHKIAILASLAFGLDIRYDDVAREGITKITRLDAQVVGSVYSRREIRQLAVAEMDEDGRVSVSVRPSLLERGHRLAEIDGVQNAVIIGGEPVGAILLEGPGAGRGPTASAVLSDLMTLSQLQAGQAYPLPFLTIPVGKKPKEIISPANEGFWLRVFSRREGQSANDVAQIMTRCNVPIEKLEEDTWAELCEDGLPPRPLSRVIQVYTAPMAEERVRRACREIEAAGLSELEEGVLMLPRAPNDV